MTLSLTLDPMPLRMTAEQFLAWSEEQLSGRYELVHGEVAPMAAEKARHVVVKLEAAIALRQAIRAQGLGYQVLIDGMAVRINDRNVYEPDVLVRAGPPLPDDALLASDPIIVVEVLSPSSRQADTGRKFKGYFSVPSVRHYLILDPEDWTVLHHRRFEDGRIDSSILEARSEGTGASPVLVLDPPGLTLAVADLFEAP